MQVGHALQDQVLHVRRSRRWRSKDRVVAFTGVLDRPVAGIVDEVDVVAGAAIHHVGAGEAVEQVGAGVAEDRVVQAVAIALQVGAALQHQGLHVRRQPKVGGREYRIVALADILDDHVAGIIDEVGVVAGAADHGVGADPAVQEIVVGVAGDHVGQGRCRSPAGRRRLATPGFRHRRSACS